MRSLPDRLNDRIERQRRGERAVTPGKIQDPEVDELATLARRLQVTPQLRVNPDFAQQLEARLLTQHTIQSLRLYGRATTMQANWHARRSPWKRLAFGTALIALLLLATMGTLSAAAQVTNPNNPLYEVRRLVQRVQYPQTNATIIQADANLHNAQDQLTMLTGQTASTNSAAYRRSLANLEQQITGLNHRIQTLPTGPDRDNLTHKLLTLKANARQTLRQLLPTLNLSEQLLTTNALEQLGDTVPHIDRATMVVTHSNKQATITITGDHLQPGAKLLIDDQLVTASPSWQNGAAVFIANWPGKASPKTIGILNPDDTAAQTTTITFTLTNDNDNDNGNSQNKGNNNGNNGQNNNNGNNNSNGNSNNSNNNGSNGNNKGNDNSNSNNNGNGNNNSNNNSNNNGNNNGNGNSNNNGNGKGKGHDKGVATPTPTPTP